MQIGVDAPLGGSDIQHRVRCRETACADIQSLPVKRCLHRRARQGKPHGHLEPEPSAQFRHLDARCAKGQIKQGQPFDESGPVRRSATREP